MDISRIEEADQMLANESVNLRRGGSWACIYNPEVACTAPRFPFKICAGCPRCTRFSRHNVVRSIFDHVRSFAISLLQNMNIQPSK